MNLKLPELYNLIFTGMLSSDNSLLINFVLNILSQDSSVRLIYSAAINVDASVTALQLIKLIKSVKHFPRVPLIQFRLSRALRHTQFENPLH